MPNIASHNGIDMADIASINGQDVPSGGTLATTATPTATGGVSSTLSIHTVVISNHGNYVNPNYSVTISIGGSVIYADSSIDHTLDTGDGQLSNTLKWVDSDSSTAQRTVTIKAQEFGKAESSTLTLNYTPTAAAYRYIRFTNTDENESAQSVGWFAIREAKLFEGAEQSGTEHPNVDMTSTTEPTSGGYSISNVGGYYSNYKDWEAFDDNTGAYQAYWSISSGQKSLIIEFLPATWSTPPTIRSFNFNIAYGYYILIEGSNDNSNWTKIFHAGPMVSGQTGGNGGDNTNLNIG